MRFLIAAVLVLSCGLCLAEDFPQHKNYNFLESTNYIEFLNTPEQAAVAVPTVSNWSAGTGADSDAVKNLSYHVAHGTVHSYQCTSYLFIATF